MENKPISRKLRLLSQLMELHEENPFKIKSIANAAFKVDKLPYPVKNKTAAELEKVDGIGKSTATKITELLETGTMVEMEDLLAKTPQGVVEMMGIKGIGAKKVATIWKELNIESLGELYYACNENRLVEAKGFGLKTQDDVRNAIEFTMASHGKFLYAQVVAAAGELISQLKNIFPDAMMECAGDFRRCCEIISTLAIVLGVEDAEMAANTLTSSELLADMNADGNHVHGKLPNGLAIDVVCVEKRHYYKTMFEETGDDEHVKAVLARISDATDKPESETLIYKKAGLAFIQPELREGATFIGKTETGSLPTLITYDDLRGTLHNHSTWSDGINTVEEMALYCRDELKLQYLGMCDHSKSAFYAKGLSIEQVLQQQEEIDHLNKKLGGFKIFKGIESDILYDGSLDYPDEILKRFDFIVASVHSVLKMDEEKATSRLIKAIENPHTTILGHPTGRLLLSRSGYPINYKKVIDACAANNVVIEINANPLRLDLDWRWHQYALDKGVWLSVNPDAHRKEGFLDMHYGILAARKGGLYKEKCLNALSRMEIETFFKSLKKRKTHQHSVELMNLKSKVIELQSAAKRPSVLVIGDLMIDHYVWGTATRLSPEAPVPIVNVKRETTTLGGAGNVVQNLVALGAHVAVAGVIGNDASGMELIEILQQEGVKTNAIIRDNLRPTTVKTRVLAGSHQLVRVDREVTDTVSPEVEEELVLALKANIEGADIVIFSDYNKGLFAPELTQRMIRIATEHQKKVVIDPKGLNYEKYKGAYIIKPNRKELAEASKTEKINNITELRNAAKTIFDQTNTTYLIVTLSEEGMAIVTERSSKLVPVKATEVFDVTGAGDTVIATIAYFVAAGLSVEEACDLANHAAAIVIRHIGSATTTVDEVLKDMED